MSSYDSKHNIISSEQKTVVKYWLGQGGTLNFMV